MTGRIFAVTNRALCADNFEERIAALCRGGVSGIILREKDLSEQDYMSLAKHISLICHDFSVPLVINSYADVARALGINRVQLPFGQFMSGAASGFDEIIVSIHSAEEAAAAERRGANALIAGHIFPTDCKKGLAPRGLDFLRQVCDAVSIPVYAIGGVTRERSGSIIEAGAAGVCVMSELMTCYNPEAVVREYCSLLR